ncbi:uncharacterized protein LOC107039249 [Diachasma alloeum]|uniref:uncharacterized protein LOC107039249 n=1 Tax=Diachasma alloeum TaxID=454923 RepID=UPI00073834C5|nr:uncharacterized protein LOC107039249 [Diachasma alloeum]
MCEIVYDKNCSKFQMGENSIDIPRSSSPPSQRNTMKRQKLNSSISSSAAAFELECRHLRTEVMTLSAKLVQMEVAVNQHHEIQKQMEDTHQKTRAEMQKLFEEEKNILQVQVNADKVKIAQLQEELKASLRRTNEARKAQVAAEAKLSRLVIFLDRQQVAMHSVLNAEGLPSLLRVLEYDSEMQTAVKREEEDLVDRHAILEINSTPKPALNPRNIKPKDESRLIQTFNASKSRPEKHKSLKTTEKGGEKLEDRPALVDNALPLLPIQEQIPIVQQKSNDAGSSKQQGMEEQEDGVSSSRVSRSQSSERGTCPTASKNGAVNRLQAGTVSRQKETERSHSSDDVESLVRGWDKKDSYIPSSWSQFLSENAQNSPGVRSDTEHSCPPGLNIKKSPSRPLNVGKAHHVLVSSRFFKINWDKQYNQPKEGRWVCNRCSRSFKSSARVIDHVWVEHYGGNYECPHCRPTGIKTLFKVSNSIRKHILKKHPDSRESRL